MYHQLKSLCFCVGCNQSTLHCWSDRCANPILFQAKSLRAGECWQCMFLFLQIHIYIPPHPSLSPWTLKSSYLFGTIAIHCSVSRIEFRKVSWATACRQWGLGFCFGDCTKPDQQVATWSNTWSLNFPSAVLVIVLLLKNTQMGQWRIPLQHHKRPLGYPMMLPLSTGTQRFTASE